MADGIGPVQIAVITAATTAGGTQVSTGQLCAKVIFEADRGNASDIIYIGSSSVSSTNYVCSLAAGNRFEFQVPNSGDRPGKSQLQLSKFYVLGGAASLKVHVSYLERLGE